MEQLARVQPHLISSYLLGACVIFHHPFPSYFIVSLPCRMAELYSSVIIAIALDSYHDCDHMADGSTHQASAPLPSCRPPSVRGRLRLRRPATSAAKLPQALCSSRISHHCVYRPVWAYVLFYRIIMPQDEVLATIVTTEQKLLPLTDDLSSHARLFARART